MTACLAVLYRTTFYIRGYFSWNTYKNSTITNIINILTETTQKNIDQQEISKTKHTITTPDMKMAKEQTLRLKNKRWSRMHNANQFELAESF